MHRRLFRSLVSSLVLLSALVVWAANDESPEQWRAERRLIALHQHVGSTEPLLKRAVSIMDRAGIVEAGREPTERDSLYNIVADTPALLAVG